MSGRLGPIPFSFELGMLLVFGLLGYILRRFDYPIAPVVVGLILGPMAEQQLRRALAISQGDPIILVHSPIAITMYAIATVAVVLPLIMRLRGRGAVLSSLAANED
jgi:putative tricarboxylic transport membrane protein